MVILWTVVVSFFVDFFLILLFDGNLAFCRRFAFVDDFAFCRWWGGWWGGWVLTFAFCSWVANGTDVFVVQPGYQLFPIIGSEQVPKNLIFSLIFTRKW